MTAALLALAAVIGVLLGRVADRVARRFVPEPDAVGAVLDGPMAVGAAPDDGARVRTVGSPVAFARPARVVPSLVGAVALTAVVHRFGLGADLAAWAWFVVLGLVLADVDLRVQLLPNRLLLPGTAVGAALLAAAAVATGRGDDLGRGLLAGLLCFSLLLVLALVSPSGLGMGDVKLVALTGLYLGWLSWSAVIDGLFLGFLAQAVLALGMLAGRRVGLRSDLPFGPALLLGALLAALLAGSGTTPLG